MTTQSRTGTARMYLRQVMNLTHGQSIFYPCEDKVDQERMRVIFSTERKRLEDTLPEILSCVRVSKKTREDVFGIMLTKYEEVSQNAILINPDGSVESMTLIPEPREGILDRLSDMLGQGLDLDYIEVNNLNLFLPELFPNRVEIKTAIAWAKNEAKKLKKESQV